MLRCSAFVLFFLLISAYFQCATGASNRVENPGFERGDLTGWTAAKATRGDRKGNIDLTRQARSGTYAARIRSESNRSWTFLRQTFDIPVGKTVTATVWVKYSNTNKPDAKRPEGNRTDDQSRENLLRNGGFEQGAAHWKWKQWTDGNRTTVKISGGVDDSTRHSGQNAFRLSYQNRGGLHLTDGFKWGGAVSGHQHTRDLAAVAGKWHRLRTTLEVQESPVSIAVGTSYNSEGQQLLVDDVELRIGQKPERRTQKNGDNPVRGGILQVPEGIEGNKAYRLTVWYKTSENLNRKTAYGRRFGAEAIWQGRRGGPGESTRMPPNVEWKGHMVFPNSTSWRKRERRVFGSYLKDGILFSIWGQGKIWMDDLRLSEIDKPVDYVGPVEGPNLKYYPIVRPWWDEPSANFTSKQKKRGYVVYQRKQRTNGKVYPTSSPANDEIAKRLRIQLSKKEYEPLRFAVYGLKKLGPTEVKLSALKSPNGDTFPSDHIQTRFVHYWPQRRSYQSDEAMIRPELLRKLDEQPSTAINKGQSQGYWFIFHATEDVPAGTYHGNLVVETKRRGKHTWPVQVKVLPIELGRSNIKRFTWYNNCRLEYRGILADFRDMRRHGCAGMVPWMIFEGFTRENGQLIPGGLEKNQRWVRAYNEVGFTLPVPGNVVTSHKAAGAMLKKGNLYKLAQQDKLPAEFKRRYEEYVRYLRDYFAEHNWPEILFYPQDEPRTEKRLAVFLKLAKLVRKAAPGARIFCPGKYHYETLGPYTDVMCGMPRRRKKVERLVRLKEKHSFELWNYENYTNKDWTPVPRARYLAGLRQHKLGADAIGHWTYQQSNGEEVERWEDYNTHDFKRPRGIKFGQITYRHPRKEVPVTTIQWETLREAQDDLRYLYTLKRYIRRAKDEGGQVADKASNMEAHIRETLANWPFDYNWDAVPTAEELDRFREWMGEAILDLKSP